MSWTSSPYEFAVFGSFASAKRRKANRKVGFAALETQHATYGRPCIDPCEVCFKAPTHHGADYHQCHGHHGHGHGHDGVCRFAEATLPTTAKS